MREASVKNAVTVELKNGESLSDLQRDGLQIIQHPGLFSFGIDAVLLSGFAEIREGDRVADLGTGTGILPILLAAKTKAAHLTGLEILAESADMAERSVRMNGLDDRISIVPGDIRKVEDYFTTASMDAVVSNPPYMIADHGRGNPNGAIAAARAPLHFRRRRARDRLSSPQQRPLQPRAQAIPPPGIVRNAAEAPPGAEADAPRASLRGPRAESRPDRMCQRRPPAARHRSSARRLPRARHIYRRSA